MCKGRERFIGSTDLKIANERKRVKNQNVLVEHLVDESVTYDSVSSFNVDITNRNKGGDLDESIQTNEDNKHNKFRENLSQKNPRVNLTVGDLSDLSHNRMFNDNIIQTFQQMLKILYPDANDLHNLVFGQSLNFAVYQTASFFQVLHDESLHCIIISTYNCKEGEVFLMDSMFRGWVAHQTKRQMYSILNSDKKELKIVALPVQKQSNAIDCEVFRLTFTHYILSEQKNPAEVNLDTSRTRTHFFHCLVEYELPNFHVVMEIIENVSTESFPLLYFVTAEWLG